MAAAGAPVAAFFRFPDLQHPPPMVSYLGERNIAIFSTDIGSFDFKLKKPELVIKSIMTKLEKRGKVIRPLTCVATRLQVLRGDVSRTYV